MAELYAPQERPDDGQVFDSSGPDAPPDPAPRGSVLPIVLAVLLAIGWIAAAGWALWPTDDPRAIAAAVAAMASPLALIGIGYLLLLRTSRAEARRYGASAAAMRAESARLEATLARLADTIAHNHAALAEEAALVDSLGATAAARLAETARTVAGEVAVADAAAQRLADAGDLAGDRLGVVLALLPKAHGETGELAQLLDAVATSVSERAAALDAQIVALADRAREADTVAGGAAQRLSAQVSRVEATGETAGARLSQVTSAMSEAVDALLARTADAVDESRKGIATQGDALTAMIDASHAALDRASREQSEALATRVGAIEAAVERIAARLAAHRDSAQALLGDLDQRVATIDAEFGRFGAAMTERHAALAGSLTTLGDAAGATSEALRASEAAARDVTGTTEGVLVALDAVAREVDETLPAALTRLDVRIAESRDGVARAKPELLALVTAAESTHAAIDGVAAAVAAEREAVDALNGQLDGGLTHSVERAEHLRDVVLAGETTARRTADDAAPRLIDALLRVRETAAAAADHARTALADVIPEAAEALRGAAQEAVAYAATDAVRGELDRIAQSAGAAATAGNRAAERVAAQLASVDAAAQALEHRIADAERTREAADRDNLSRRVSLLIEALHSASIDITRIFSVEVADTSWGAYLKGDRGIFTRRAVRLLENGEARDVARRYDDDPAFREQVNRYIHDFESMLRAILTERDGSPLGVTLLSSDMGKLYVALAQAIERLR